MKSICKYPLNPNMFELCLPEGSRLLSVQAQNGKPQIWVMVDSDPGALNSEVHDIRIIGTGADATEVADPASWNFLGTFQLNDGRLVFHVFHRRKP